MNIRPSSLKRSCANFDKGAHERRRRITFNDFVVVLNKDEQTIGRDMVSYYAMQQNTTKYFENAQLKIEQSIIKK